MTENKEVHHAMVVTALAEYYNRVISATVLSMYVEDLMVLSVGELQQAAKLYRNDPANKFFPIPAALISLVRPEQTAQDAANEAASNIIRCLSEDGHTNAVRAQAKMGELAWAVVKRMGGWTRLCEEVQIRDIPTYRAQFRELAATLHRKESMGLSQSLPELPKSRLETLVQLKSLNRLS